MQVVPVARIRRNLVADVVVATANSDNASAPDRSTHAGAAEWALSGKSNQMVAVTVDDSGGGDGDLSSL